MNEQIVKKEEEFVRETKSRQIEKLKFCIISYNKATFSKNRLTMFAMENVY